MKKKNFIDKWFEKKIDEKMDYCAEIKELTAKKITEYFNSLKHTKKVKAAIIVIMLYFFILLLKFMEGFYL